MSDRYGYIAIETLLNFCENSKYHAVTPNDFMRMARVQVPERKTGRWIDNSDGLIEGACNYCSVCGEYAIDLYDYCPNCGAKMGEGEADGQNR